MTGVLALLAAFGTSNITVPSNWGVSGPGASPQTSATKVLTVPSNNPGNVLLHYNTAPVGTGQYIKNGGAPVTFTVDTVVNFSNTDTLAFKLTGAGDTMTVNVKDNTTQAVIGTCTLQTA